jgi:hypothetical protein
LLWTKLFKNVHVTNIPYYKYDFSIRLFKPFTKKVQIQISISRVKARAITIENEHFSYVLVQVPFFTSIENEPSLCI